ncbi:hypothetical protein QUA07_14830 [Microcoleus sp. T3_A4]|uniref:hypothetical protein n=1 Tax=Microcoleus sp. T3_A4 TaxID=2818968 RepID=UPI002FD3B38A
MIGKKVMVGLTSIYTHRKNDTLPILRAGETPNPYSPHEIIFIVEQARCLFLTENNFIVEQAKCLFLKEVSENPRIFG